MAFARKYWQNDSFLKLWRGKGSWSVKCKFGQQYAFFTSGWTTFVEENHLKVGNVCAFEYIKNPSSVRLKVSHFGGEDISSHRPLTKVSMAPFYVGSPLTMDGSYLRLHVLGKGSWRVNGVALVSLALFGAFVSRAETSTVYILTPKVFTGLIVGVMLPYWISAMTMKRVLSF
uniref:H(+)-exporting diphosphatase n=1 Tax=Nicotiana tabacum TaxID=4097 RepID=A0A1S4DDH6_TOBAC|nr:uncharacterized protein LOC104086059 isoform X2 [Nicotiana tomentosiformis]XP_016511461.1 PREDICTED: uncharacterized protein LOC107828625 [Nicotiana tabacum]